jgi:dihydrofolate reductase
MRTLIVVAHISLESFVANAKGNFDDFVGGEESLEFVCGLTEKADAALFGRKSYQLIDAAWVTAGEKAGASKLVKQYANWYNSVPKYVLSKTLSQEKTNNATVINDHLATDIQDLKNKAGKDILVFGSPTALDTMLDLDLIDTFWIVQHPVLFGDGIPLFKKRESVTKMNLTVTHQLPSGIICLRYELNKANANTK